MPFDMSIKLRVPTRVFPVPLAPAIDVISPYLKPPSNAFRSIVAEPELAGRGLALSCAWADASRLEPSRGGAAWGKADICNRDGRFKVDSTE